MHCSEAICIIKFIVLGTRHTSYTIIYIYIYITCISWVIEMGGAKAGLHPCPDPTSHPEGWKVRQTNPDHYWREDGWVGNNKSFCSK